MSLGTNMYRRLMLATANCPPVRGFMLKYGKRLARRFVASGTRDELWPHIRKLNDQGILATIDYLGESIAHIGEANKCGEEYIQLLKDIHAEGVLAHVSMKPTQMGLALDPEACFRLIRSIVTQASAHSLFIRLDMENSPFTQATLDLVQRLHQEGKSNVGTVIQAYLHRSRADAEHCIKDHIQLRLVKGAYKEAAAIAYQNKSDIRKSFQTLIRMHLDQGVYVAVATHDDAIIDWLKQYAAEHAIEKSAFEFQMLYGLRMNEQAKLAAEGYRIRCYVPYGEMWYPYYTRRLAEKPSHLWLILKNIFR